MYPEYVVDEAQWRDFLADRRACMVGQKLAARFGWKVGDRIPLKAPGYLGGGSWDFDVAGIYRGTLGGGVGLWLAHGLASQDITNGLILLYLPPSALLLGMAFALVTGRLAGLFPALGAMRLNVAEALRRV